MNLFGNQFLLFFLFSFHTFCQGTVTQTPSTACVGDRITISCILTPPAGQTFISLAPRFLIGESNISVSANNINDSQIHTGVDLTRLTAYNNAGSITMVSGVVTLLSYLTSDEGLRIGCEVSRNTGMDLIENIQLIQAAPPSAPSIQSISSNIDPNTCSATISLNWIPPSYTNRTVDLYYLSLQNGTALDSIAAPTNSYSHNATLLLDTVYAYSVSASSCAGNSTAATSYLGPIQKAPPSAPNSLQSSVSNFNTATCSADISLSWNPPSDRTADRYFLDLDGSPLATTNSNSYIHSTILNINTDYQYSVTAMSCAGNSTNSSSTVNSVKSYSLMRSSQYVCLAFDNVTRVLTVNWELSTPTQPSGVSGLDISYSLQLLYSYSRQGVTCTNSTNFTLPSSQFSYNSVLTAHNFTQLDGVETNITANLMIVQQCGQSFSGTAMECFLNSNNPAILPTSSIPTSTSTEMSSSSTSIQMITTTVPSNIASINSSSTLLPTSIILALLFLLSLIVNLILIIIVILLQRRNKSYSPSKPAPSHPYEYIDLDKMSGNISSPTQQQSPQDYVPMSSVSKLDSTKPPTHYANLK